MEEEDGASAKNGSPADKKGKRAESLDCCLECRPAQQVTSPWLLFYSTVTDCKVLFDGVCDAGYSTCRGGG